MVYLKFLDFKTFTVFPMLSLRFTLHLGLTEPSVSVTRAFNSRYPLVCFPTAPGLSMVSHGSTAGCVKDQVQRMILSVQVISIDNRCLTLLFDHLDGFHRFQLNRHGQ